MPRPRRRWLSAAAAGALALFGPAACGGGGSTTGGQAAPAEETPGVSGDSPAPVSGAASSAVPDVTVRELATGGEFALASVVPSDRPVLLWFWTPY